jgi:putative adhesin
VSFSLILALLTTSTAVFGATGSDTFHWSGRVPAGQLIEVRGINGNIHAEPARGESVDVIAYKNGRLFDPGEIEVKVVEHGGGVTICAVYPTADEHRNECVTGASGGLSTPNDVSVDFVVRVPRGVRFVARTINGLVEANSLEADAEGHTVNGNVRLSTAGAAQGETVNGSIVASVGRICSPLKFSTVNGSITVEVPSEASARVRARTVNGRINTEFPLTIRGQYFAKRVDGPIGNGGPEMRIATVNGSISLRRSRRSL